MPILAIKNFSKTYSGGKKAVNNLSLEVAAGEIYGFIGHNGAGKTTTIRAIVGVMDFESGEILIDGKSVKKQPEQTKQITGFIPDNPDIYEYITGIQYLNYVGDVFGVGAKERKERIGRLANLLGMTDSLGDLIASYSHGMKQKVALIGAFLHEPKLLVLDEPFVGLDPEASFHLKNLMRDLCGQGGAIFFSTHVLEVAEKLCSRIAIIKGGEIYKEGETAELLGDSSLEDLFLELVKNDA